MPVYEIAMLVDARGPRVPSPIATTAQALHSVKAGEIVEVLATDPACVDAFAAWARSTGNELIAATSDGRTYRFVIRHGGDDPEGGRR